MDTLPDMASAGIASLDPALLRAELLADHRVRPRRFIARLLPPGGVGVELGVFTGLFSGMLLAEAKPRTAYFVDPWESAFGVHYPDWGDYTDHGRLRTGTARAAAQARIARRAGAAETHLVDDTSEGFLAALDDGALDWAYLDTTHAFEDTARELVLLRKKVRSGGIVAGDDWHHDPGHPHAGVARAVSAALDEGLFDLVGIFESHQWAVRVP